MPNQLMRKTGNKSIPYQTHWQTGTYSHIGYWNSTDLTCHDWVNHIDAHNLDLAKLVARSSSFEFYFVPCFLESKAISWLWASMQIGSNSLMGCKIQLSLENSYRIVINWGLHVKRKSMEAKIKSAELQVFCFGEGRRRLVERLEVKGLSGI